MRDMIRDKQERDNDRTTVDNYTFFFCCFSKYLMIFSCYSFLCLTKVPALVIGFISHLTKLYESFKPMRCDHIQWDIQNLPII